MVKEWESMHLVYEAHHMPPHASLLPCPPKVPSFEFWYYYKLLTSCGPILNIYPLFITTTLDLYAEEKWRGEEMTTPCCCENITLTLVVSVVNICEWNSLPWSTIFHHGLDCAMESNVNVSVYRGVKRSAIFVEV